MWRESEMILPSVLSEASSLEAKRGGEQRDTEGRGRGFPGEQTEGDEKGIQMEEVEREREEEKTREAHVVR